MMDIIIIIKANYLYGLPCISTLLANLLQFHLQNSVFFRFFATVLRKTVPKPKKDRDV